ncbi:MAG: protoporphyrinogen oxidase [Acidimicrobiia bacterium]|nr:protoporphyrinogen oxidase [Acidimicrobiia bacterium]
MSRRFAVVGGGIAGLAAAWELRRRDPDAEVTVLEATGRLGGKLRTSAFAGRMVDEGADAFLARVPEGYDLCVELGLADALVAPTSGRAYVAGGDDLHALPAGLVLGVPTDAAAVRATGWLGEDAADRVAAEPAQPLAPLGDDDAMSVGELVRRRLGDEVLDRLVDPLIGGINAGDTDRLSLRAAAPQLADAVATGTGLVAGLRDRPPPDAGPVFWAHPGGMAAVVDELVSHLRADGVDLRSLVPVTDLTALLAGAGRDGVVVATPAPAAARLVGGEAAEVLAALRHASVALVSLALRPGEVTHPLDAGGLLVPRVEGRVLTACSFASTKWAHLAPAAGDDTVVLRASAGRFGAAAALDLDDDDLVAAVLADLDDLLGLAGDPTEVRVNRWVDGFPQYEPGHLARLAAVEADLAARLPLVRLAGAAHRGIGIPACIRQGRAAAAALTR